MKLVSKSDILYTVTIGAAALALFFALSLFGGNTVKITMQGKTIYEGSISQNDTVTVEGDYTNIIKIENGEVWVERSTCPNQICVHSGKIRSGSIVCAPNGVVICVEGGGTDAVAG